VFFFGKGRFQKGACVYFVFQGKKQQDGIVPFPQRRNAEQTGGFFPFNAELSG
jgi:hypothetical protein